MFFYFAHFFGESKSIENEKFYSPQMIKVCQKNFHLSKENMVFWPFLWFCQNRKNAQKFIFYFKRWKFFLAPHNYLGRLKFFIFYTFWFDKKMGKIRKKALSHTTLFSVFGPKMPKILIFMKKYFSMNFSMSNFGQKRFSILLTNIYIWTR